MVRAATDFCTTPVGVKLLLQLVEIETALAGERSISDTPRMHPVGFRGLRATARAQHAAHASDVRVCCASSSTTQIDGVHGARAQPSAERQLRTTPRASAAAPDVLPSPSRDGATSERASRANPDRPCGFQLDGGPQDRQPHVLDASPIAAKVALARSHCGGELCIAHGIAAPRCVPEPRGWAWV